MRGVLMARAAVGPARDGFPGPATHEVRDHGPRGRASRKGSRGSGSATVLVDQPSKDVDAFDAAAGLEPPIGKAGNGHLKVDASMRSGGVVMRQVGSQDMLQVPAVADQQPVQALD